MSAPEIFGRVARRRRRDRSAATLADHDFLYAAMADGLLDRLSIVRRDFDRALLLGAAPRPLLDGLVARARSVTAADPGFGFARAVRGVQCDEDRLPFADDAFDLVVAAGTLDTVNDLPGALTLIRRALRPDGLFLGAFAGAGSLPGLRAAAMTADLATGSAAAHVHPLIDVRAAGDLLARTGFALPVADVETLAVRYAEPARLLADLRGMGATNVLVARPKASLSWRAALEAALARESALVEQFALVFVTGWAPGPGQPQPARRGSGTASLAAALKPRAN